MSLKDKSMKIVVCGDESNRAFADEWRRDAKPLFFQGKDKELNMVVADSEFEYFEADDVNSCIEDFKKRILFVIHTIKCDIGKSRSDKFDEILLNRIEGMELCLKEFNETVKGEVIENEIG